MNYNQRRKEKNKLIRTSPTIQAVSGDQFVTPVEEPVKVVPKVEAVVTEKPKKETPNKITKKAMKEAEAIQDRPGTTELPPEMVEGSETE